MASDSEPRKFFWGPWGPKSRISGSKRPVRLLKLQNYIEHNTHRLFWRHLWRRLSSALCWW